MAKERSKPVQKPTTKPVETPLRNTPIRRTQSNPIPKGDPSRGGPRPPKKD